MAKYRDIPGRRALPGALIPEEAPVRRKGLHPATKVTLGLLVGILLVFLALAYGGQGMSMYVHWYWVAPLLASLALMCVSVLVMLGLRRLGRTGWSRVGLTSVGVLVIAAALAVGVTLTGTFFEHGERPVAYLDSPEGETIVVMRSLNPNRDPDKQGGFTVQYTAYQMLNRFFLLNLGTANCPPVYSTSELDPEWEVEWLENGDARLYLPEYQDLPHGHTFLTVYDLDNLSASIDEKGVGTYLLNATPEPEIEPTPEPTPAPTVDPFAY